MHFRILAAVAIVAATVQPAMAQNEQRDNLYAAYGLWGMMDAAANFCWEVANYDVAYMEAHQNWLANNVFVRDELDGVRASIGQPDSLASDAEAAGGKGILDILKQALNPEEACTNWYNETRAGNYDAEVFAAQNLGILRERDGM